MDGPVNQSQGGSFLIQDPALTNARLAREFVNLGGVWDREAQGFRFQDEGVFQNADLLLNTWLDATVIMDRNAYFEREVLTSRDEFYYNKFGGEQRRLTNGEFAYQFPTPQQAANALAVVFTARQLQAKHVEALDIVRETLPQEVVEQLFVDHYDRTNPPPIGEWKAEELDRWGAIGIIKDARPMLFELGISPSHEKNVERLSLIRENLDAEQSTQIFGFDTIMEPMRYDELIADHVATAKVVMAAQPFIRELGLNIEGLVKEREAVLNPRQAARRVAVPQQVAETALARENITRDIGAYAQDEQERLAAERDELSFGPERFQVAKSLREALDSEGKVTGDEIELQPGDLVHGRIVSYNANVVQSDLDPEAMSEAERREFDRKVAMDNFVYTPMTKTLRDTNGEFIGVEIEALHRPNVNSFGAAPVGTVVEQGVNTVSLMRPDGTKVEYGLQQTTDGVALVGKSGGKTQTGQTFADLESAKSALNDIATKARVSAGVQDELLGKRGHAIIAINQFAHPVFQSKYSVRKSMADDGQAVTFAVQPNGQIVHAAGHLTRPVVRMSPDKNHVVERPTEPQMIADYNSVLALTKLQAAADIRAIAQKSLEKAKTQGATPPEWAVKCLKTQPATVKERTISSLTPDQMKAGASAGIECEVKNIGQYYVGVRNGFNVSIHELSAFPIDRQFTVGERFGVVYEDGIPREYDPKEPVLTYERVSEVVLEHVGSRDMDGAAVMESRESARERNATAGAVLDFMDKTNRVLAKFSDDAQIEQMKPTDSLKMYGSQETFSGSVLATDLELQIAAVGRIVDGEPCFTVVNLKHFENAANLGYLDQVTITVNNERFTVDQHRTREELMQDFNQRAKAALAKEQQKPIEAIIQRDPNPQNDLLQGDVLLKDAKLQAFAIKTGPTSVGSYKTESIDRPLEVGDHVRIVSRDYSNTVTNHTPKLDRERDQKNLQNAGLAS